MAHGPNSARRLFLKIKVYWITVTSLYPRLLWGYNGRAWQLQQNSSGSQNSKRDVACFLQQPRIIACPGFGWSFRIGLEAPLISQEPRPMGHPQSSVFVRERGILKSLTGMMKCLTRN